MSQRINLLDPIVRANPFPYYAQMRRESPVCQVEPNGLWAITRYEDVVAAFKNTEVFSSEGLRMATEPPYLKRHNPLSDSMVLADPPRHGKLRALVNPAFTATMLSRVESYARDVASRLGEMLLQKQQVEFVSDFALGVPASVIALLVGLDVDDTLPQRLKNWSDVILSVGATPPTAHEHLVVIRKTIEEMESHMRQVIKNRRNKPKDDLISELISVRVDGEVLTDDELTAFLFLLVVAGVETTMILLTLVAMTLAKRPEWMDRLRYNEVLITHFIEEVLRYEPPTHATLRLTTRETEVAGVKLPAHTPVMLVVASALHDETQYPNPEEFQPERRVQANLAFGYGPHFCLGAPLARMEARVALDTLLSMCSKFELLTDTLEWNQSLNVRTLVKLPLAVHPL